MVGEQHLGLDDVGGTNQLLRGHSIGLVARQESDVNVLDFSHLGNVFGVAGNVNP